MPHLQYPIGKFRPPSSYTEEGRARRLEEMAGLPARLREAVEGLSDAQLDTPYRPDGWTVRQVVHHLADAHMVGYARCKRAATDDLPPATPYAEEHWAELADARTGPVEWSLAILEPLHLRWVAFLRALPAADFARAFAHPQAGPTSLDRAIALYAWHGNHHLAHIIELKQRMGW